MKKLRILSIIFFILNINSFALENKKTFFSNGDIVKVESCDQWQWCKLSDGSGYVKEFYFKKDKKEPSLLVQSYKGITYLYQLVGLETKNIPLEQFIKVNKVDYLIDNARANYMYGYLRDIDLEKYKEKYIIKEEQKVKILVKKEDNQIVEQIVKTAPVISKIIEPKQNYFTYFDVGVAKFSSNHPDNLDMVLDFGLGYNLDKNQNIILGYMGNIENSQDQMRGVELNNFYLGYNYNFLGEYNPTLGLIAGYSMMKVYLDKIDGTNIDEEQDKQLFYGIQSGLSKEIIHNLVWELKLSYHQYDLKTPNVNVTNSFNLFGGIVYKFD